MSMPGRDGCLQPRVSFLSAVGPASPREPPGSSTSPSSCAQNTPVGCSLRSPGAPTPPRTATTTARLQSNPQSSVSRDGPVPGVGRGRRPWEPRGSEGLTLRMQGVGVGVSLAWVSQARSPSRPLPFRLPVGAPVPPLTKRQAQPPHHALGPALQGDALQGDPEGAGALSGVGLVQNE